MSVIQGPHGTGKTQTILNIIANLLIQNRTVEIVSNNNSATENVLEKLASAKYGLDFLAAPLGKRKNKNAFINGQSGCYPDPSSWEKNPVSGHMNQRQIDVTVGEVLPKFSEIASEHIGVIAPYRAQVDDVVS